MKYLDVHFRSRDVSDEMLGIGICRYHGRGKKEDNI